MNETLVQLAYEVRAKTLWLIEGISDEMARFAAPGLFNSVLWHAGHVLVVVEHLGVAQATGLPPAVPEGWFEKFGWGSQPQTVTQWPALAEVDAELRGQLPRLIAALSSLSPQQLDQVIDTANGTTLHYDILHALHDEANHQGEMWLLRKMHGKLDPAVTD